MNINKEMAWGFFDVSCQGSVPICGLDFILYMFDTHFFTCEANLGQRTNNKGEFTTLFALLKCVVELNIHQLQVFDDSKSVINWMRNRLWVYKLSLLPLAQHSRAIIEYFSRGYIHTCLS
jgi:ribonuclease HI